MSFSARARCYDSQIKRWLLLYSLVISCAAESAPTDTKPNIILIVADDLGWGDLGYLGGQPRTPNLDRLAKEGVQLSQFHTFPVCTPSRAALLTGRSPLRFGLAWSPLPPWSSAGLPIDEKTLADSLSAEGYRTVAIGKWHLGHQLAQHHPNRRGFDDFYGFLNGSVDYFQHRTRTGGHDWQRNGKSLTVEGYATGLLAKESERVIQSHDFAQPIFLYLPFGAPHQPLQAPPESVAAYAHIGDPARQIYCAMVTEMDQAIARVLAALVDRGQLENSLVVFISDNGAALNQGGNNGDLRGGKASVFEGGLRVPATLYWPGHLAAGSHFESFTSIMDLAPTLMAVAGNPLDAGQVDGRNLWPILTHTGSLDDPSAAFVSCIPNRTQWALYSGDWKYIRRLSLPGGKVREWLFRFADDPQEKFDLAKSEPERLVKMRAELATWLALDPSGSSLTSPPDCTKEKPAQWKAPADWARAK
jgi:arylsulfatase A-like enzyme